VDAAGNVSEPLGIAISTAAGAQRAPRVASDGEGFLVTWADHRNATSDIFGARLSAGGVVGDPEGIPIASSMSEEDSPVLAFDGVHYLVAFDDASGAGDIRGIRVNKAGTVVDPIAFVVADAAHAETLFAAASGLSGDVLVSYAGVDEVSGKLRGHVRVVSEGPPTGQPCASAIECLSGFCVDGVCCDSACGDGSASDCVACSANAGAVANGVCSPVTGSSCDDGSACTAKDVCQSGTCVGTSAVTCPAPVEPCQVAMCVPANGECMSQALPDGTACPDGKCVAGTCDKGGAASTSSSSSSSGGVGGGDGAGGAGGAGGDSDVGGAGGEGGVAGAGGQGGGKPPLTLEDGGCGCRVAPMRLPAASPALALAWIGLLARRGLKRRARHR
jgi:hypothetical protein